MKLKSIDRFQSYRILFLFAEVFPKNVSSTGSYFSIIYDYEDTVLIVSLSYLSLFSPSIILQRSYCTNVMTHIASNPQVHAGFVSVALQA